MPRLALDADAPAHQLHQAAADGQAEAGAAEAARHGRIHLAERLEQPLHVLRGDADAGVVHGEIQVHPRGMPRQRPHRDADLAPRGEFHGVADEVDQHLPQARRITAHDSRCALGDLVEQVDLLLRRARGQEVERALEAVAQGEFGVLELEPAGLDLGEVEDVVDDGQQRLAALADGLGGLALLGREGRIQQQARHADDAIHGRADLVAHHREKLALGDVGLLRGLLGHTQQLGLTLALGDVELQAHVAGALAAFIGQRLDFQFDPDLPAVLRVGEDFTEIRPAHFCGPGHRFQRLRVGLGPDHEGDGRTALDLFQGETEQPREAVVDPLHAPLWVSEDHAAGGAARHQREPAGFRLGAAQVGGHAFR